MHSNVFEHLTYQSSNEYTNSEPTTLIDIHYNIKSKVVFIRCKCRIGITYDSRKAASKLVIPTFSFNNSFHTNGKSSDNLLLKFGIKWIVRRTSTRITEWNMFNYTTCSRFIAQAVESISRTTGSESDKKDRKLSLGVLTFKQRVYLQ